MRYLTCYLAAVATLAAVSVGYTEDVPQPVVPFVKFGPFMRTFDPSLSADDGKTVVIVPTRPVVVELPRILVSPTPIEPEVVLLPPQQPAKLAKPGRKYGPVREAAPLGGAPQPTPQIATQRN